MLYWLIYSYAILHYRTYKHAYIHVYIWLYQYQPRFSPWFFFCLLVCVLLCVCILIGAYTWSSLVRDLRVCGNVCTYVCLCLSGSSISASIRTHIHTYTYLYHTCIHQLYIWMCKGVWTSIIICICSPLLSRVYIICMYAHVCFYCCCHLVGAYWLPRLMPSITHTDRWAHVATRILVLTYSQRRQIAQINEHTNTHTRNGNMPKLRLCRHCFP